MRLIDADAMLTRLERWNTSDSTDKALYNFTLRRILEQPTNEPEQKHGKWLNAEHAPNYLCYCTCSVCGKRQTIESANYCPNCGAKMDMERE